MSISPPRKSDSTDRKSDSPSKTNMTYGGSSSSATSVSSSSANSANSNNININTAKTEPLKADYLKGIPAVYFRETPLGVLKWELSQYGDELFNRTADLEVGLLLYKTKLY